jgi:flagellar basal body rod protein FlgC
MPNVSTSDQLIDLMQAQDGYQADTESISRAMAAYQAALTIGA